MDAPRYRPAPPHSAAPAAGDRPGPTIPVHPVVALTTLTGIGFLVGIATLLVSPAVLLICSAPNGGRGAAACDGGFLGFFLLGPVPRTVVVAAPAFVALLRRRGRGHAAATASWVLAALGWTAWGLLLATLLVPPY